MSSDFADALGEATEIELPRVGGGAASEEFDQSRKKAEHFLEEDLAEAAVAEVRSGEP